MKNRCLKLVLFFALLVIPALSFPRPSVEIVVHAGEGPVYESVKGDIVGSIVSSNRFYVALREALKVLFEEVRLQDLLTTGSELLSKEVALDYRLEVWIEDVTIIVHDEERSFIENDVSGNYIKVEGKYVEVYPGVDYGPDPLNPKGRIVKGRDGVLYAADTFYSRYRHRVKVAHASFEVAYKLWKGEEMVFEDEKSFDLTLDLVRYRYDGYNDVAVKEVLPYGEVLKELGGSAGKRIYEDLRERFPLVASIEDVKGIRVVLDVGGDDGAKSGMYFEGEDTFFKVGETTPKLSECEITKAKGPPKTGMAAREFMGSPFTAFPNVFSASAFVDSSMTVYAGIGVKAVNVFSHPLAYAQLLFGFGSSWWLFTQFSVNLYGPLYVGVRSGVSPDTHVEVVTPLIELHLGPVYLCYSPLGSTQIVGGGMWW